MALDPQRAVRPAVLVVLVGCGGDPGAVERAALEARVTALESAQGAPVARPEAVVDPETGVLVEVLTDAQALGCVNSVTQGAMAALYAHEARWGAFTDDIAALEWAPEAPCRWYVAARVVPFTADGTKVEVEVVVTRGALAGRRWVSDLSIEPREAPRWTSAEWAAAAGGAWTAPLGPPPG